MSEKPKFVLASTAAAGLCHWCLQPPRYTVLARDHLHEKDLILRVCRGHLAFIQGSNRAPVELRAVDGYESPPDLSTPEQYVQRRVYSPDVKTASVLTAG